LTTGEPTEGEEAFCCSAASSNIKFLELYSGFMPEDNVRVFKLFKDEATAELFSSTTDVASRDLWLQTELEELAQY
jgi:hypothetical protein